jgi:GTP-binding protein HflX
VAPPDAVAGLAAAHPGARAVSAATGRGVAELLDAAAARLRALIPIVELEIPYERGDVVAALHRDGDVLVEVHGEGGTRVRARLPRVDLGRYEPFVVEGDRRAAR